MDTRYAVKEKASGDILGYLPLETGELVGIVREKEKPILLLIIAVIAALVLLVALITASLYKMVNKPLDGGSDASSASSEIVIADGEAYDGTMDNGKTDSGEMRFIEFPAFTTIYVSPDSTVDLVNPESNHVYFKYTILENDEVLYESDYIAPGQKYAWQASDYITGAGEHAVVFSVSTVGVDDQQPRNGAEFAVTAVVS